MVVRPLNDAKKMGVTMLYAFLCCHDEAVSNGWTKEEDDAILAKRHKVTEKLAAKGKLGPALRLMPTTAATTVRLGREPVVLDGPFAETKEALLGFYLIDCESLEEAIGIAKDIGRDEKVVFEIRPVKLFAPQGIAS
jgi:hypothetical protein